MSIPRGYRFVLAVDPKNIKASLKIKPQHYYAEVGNPQMMEFRGEVQNIMFLKSLNAFNASIRRGWVDVTEEYKTEQAVLEAKKKILKAVDPPKEDKAPASPGTVVRSQKRPTRRKSSRKTTE